MSQLILFFIFCFLFHSKQDVQTVRKYEICVKHENDEDENEYIQIHIHLQFFFPFLSLTYPILNEKEKQKNKKNLRKDEHIIGVCAQLTRYDKYT